MLIELAPLTQEVVCRGSVRPLQSGRGSELQAVLRKSEQWWERLPLTLFSALLSILRGDKHVPP